MRMKTLFLTTLAIITLLLVACSSDGETLSGGNVTSQDPTATAKLVPQTPAAGLVLGLGSFENIDLARLIEELLNSPELTECLTSAMSLSSLMELAEREPTDADIEQILPCLSEDQLDALKSTTGSGLDFGSFEDAGLAEPMEGLLNSPELADCLSGSTSISSLMELAEGELTDADIESILPCLSEDEVDALKSATAPDSDLANLEGVDIEGLTRELLSSPDLMACLTSSMSLSSLLELAEGEATDADLELILPCLSEDQLDSLLQGFTGQTGTR